MRQLPTRAAVRLALALTMGRPIPHLRMEFEIECTAARKSRRGLAATNSPASANRRVDCVVKALCNVRVVLVMPPTSGGRSAGLRLGAKSELQSRIF